MITLADLKDMGFRRIGDFFAYVLDLFEMNLGERANEYIDLMSKNQRRQFADYLMTIPFTQRELYQIVMERI